MESEGVMAISTKDETRTKRFNLRATPKQEKLIRVAAERKGLNVTDFILESACERAEQTIADQSHFVVDQTAWDLFMKALDEPPCPISQVRKLFSDPSIAESR
jgi:uncharacterized protein (DUF1778 family)